jgi:hypothetical protein
MWLESNADSWATWVCSDEAGAHREAPEMGVPALGPFLLNAYGNHFRSHTPDGAVMQYAEDTVVLVKCTATETPNQCVHSLKHVTAAMNWYLANCLDAHIRKTACVVFRKLA